MPNYKWSQHKTLRFWENFVKAWHRMASVKKCVEEQRRVQVCLIVAKILITFIFKSNWNHSDSKIVIDYFENVLLNWKQNSVHTCIWSLWHCAVHWHWHTQSNVYLNWCRAMSTFLIRTFCRSFWGHWLLIYSLNEYFVTTNTKKL